MNITAIEYGDQDEWSPYIAFPFNNTKEILLSHRMKCKPCDQMRRKNNSCECESSLNGPCSVIKKHLLVKSNSSIAQNLHTKDKNNKQITEIPCSDELSTLNENLQRENTADLWDKLKKCCKTKSRTLWQRSLAHLFFLKSLEVEKEPTSGEDRNRVVSTWNLQRCKCEDLRETNKNVESLDKMMENDEDCDSPCLCPKYFISKSGLVFGSLEEKECFDEKMEKMDEVFKSELISIKRQHERLREDLISELPDNICSQKNTIP